MASASTLCRALLKPAVVWSHAPWLVAAILAGEAVLSALIVLRVRYTEIDWRAYMEEVEGPIVHGVLDYSQLRGGTGPLVYPGGFVYVYGALRALAGGDGTHVRAAQWAFVLVYVGTQALVCSCYSAARSRSVPPWTLLLLCVSLRLHSIYVLRLFNDCWAMLFAWAAFALFCRSRWRSGCVCFSLAVGIKMSVLLYAPGLLLLLLEAHGVRGAVAHIALCAAVQLALGAPFLLTNPVGYVLGAFGGFGDLQQRWSVNWRMLPPAVFTSRAFAPALLLGHLALLAALASRRWCHAEGGLSRSLRRAPLRCPDSRLCRRMRAEHVLSVLAGCNAVGVAFSRSLHFQFYCWFFHATPFLLWRCEVLPTALRLLAVAALEYAWSFGVDRAEGTPTELSACAHQLAHLVIVAAVWLAPATAAWDLQGSDELLASFNNCHTAEVAALAARRCGVVPSEAAGAVLISAGEEELVVQLWDGEIHRVALRSRGAIFHQDAVDIDARRARLLCAVQEAASA
jgi:alpha-1,3-mannosyltransferase